MADIEITTKTIKRPLSGDERVILHDPAAPDQVSVTSWEAIAEHLISDGLVGAPVLTDLVLALNPVDIGAPAGALVGTISGHNPRSTLNVSPASHYALSGNDILKGTANYSLAGQYQMTVTETLAGSANSPHTTTTAVVVQRDLTPTLGLPWSPDYFPELFLNIWVQEDLPDGPVSVHKARGIHGHTATQSSAVAQPVKRADHGGVEFAAQSGKSLIIPNIPDGEKSSRWALMTFRVNSSVGAAVQIYAVNNLFTSGGWIPRLSAASANVLQADWRGNAGDTAGWGFACNGLVSDGSAWNVCLTHRRNGSVYAALNGVDGVPNAANPNVPFTCFDQTVTGLIGTTAVNGFGYAYDVILQGQKELSDATRHKLEGWAAHRRGFEARLPTDHPYRTAHPVIDADDFPDVYKFDPVTWSASTQAAGSAARFVNRGNPPPPEPPMTVVFRDDFRVDSVGRSSAASGGPLRFHEIWFAPGYNTAVGVNAALSRVQDVPDCYIHDPSAKTMTLRLQHDAAQNRWETGTIYTIDDAGTGRSWAGERVYELRMTLPAAPVIGGLWYGFWSYMTEHLFNRIGERIELDFFELDGAGQQWLNGMASHVHSGRLPGKMGHLASDAPAFKPFGYTMNTANVGREIDFWDGQPHTYQIRVLQDFTYLIIDNVELGRMPTAREYLRRSHINISSGYRSGNGAGTPGTFYDMTLHHVEVRQPTATVESFATPFTARPTLSGAMQPGDVIICDPKLPTSAVAAADFWWYRNGYPIVSERLATYATTADDVGSRIRCMVRATGWTDQPEAWSAETAVLGSGTAGSSNLLVGGQALVAEGQNLRVEPPGGVASVSKRKS